MSKYDNTNKLFILSVISVIVPHNRGHGLYQRQVMALWSDIDVLKYE